MDVGVLRDGGNTACHEQNHTSNTQAHTPPPQKKENNNTHTNSNKNASTSGFAPDRGVSE